MNRFTFYFIVTSVAVGAYMLYIHNQQQQASQLAKQGQAAPSDAIASGFSREGFESPMEARPDPALAPAPPAPIIVPELPPAAPPAPAPDANAGGGLAPAQPRYGPRAFANSGGRISVSVGAVHEQPPNEALGLAAPSIAAVPSAQEWAALAQDVRDIKQAVTAMRDRVAQQPTVYETYF